MVYARYEGTAVDEAGNVLANCTVEVREDRAGRPVVPLFSDRQGTVPMGNPIQTDSQGRFAFHARGGVYWVRVYQGPSQEPTRQYIRRYQALGTAAERDVEDLASALEAGTATFATKADLDAFTPEAEGIGGKVTTGADAGFYTYDFDEEEWVLARRLHDSLAQLVVTGGTDDDIEAAVDAAIAEAAIQMLWIEAPGDNTGPVTINGKEVLTASGNSLLEGQWFEGRTYWLTDEGATYKLRTESDIAGIATAVEEKAQEAIDNAGYAKEWAQSDTLISEAAGGDGVDDRSAKWWAGQASEATIPDGSVTETKLASALRGKLIAFAANRTALAAFDGGTYQAVDLMESGRKGLFQWDASDLSAEVGADPNQGIFVAPVSDATGASGAWVRHYEGTIYTSWFGVTDGADVTSDLQACFDTVRDVFDGGCVCLLAGTYLTSGTLEIYSNFHLTAKGRAILKLADGEVESLVQGSMMWLFQATNVVVDKIAFDGNKAANDTDGAYGNGLTVYDCHRVTINGLQLVDHARDGITVQRHTVDPIGNKDISITDCMVTGCGSPSMTAGGEGIMVTEGEWITISDNICRNNKLRGINLETLSTAITNFVLADNICDGNTWGGIGTYGSTSGTITGNVLTDNSDHGIDIQSNPASSIHLVVSGNRIRNSTKGVNIIQQLFVTLSANQINDCGTGIWMKDVNAISLVGNFVYGSAAGGIDFTEGTNQNISISGGFVGASDSGAGGNSNIQGNCSECNITGVRIISGGAADYGIDMAGSSWIVTANNLNGAGVTGAINDTTTWSLVDNNLGVA